MRSEDTTTTTLDQGTTTTTPDQGTTTTALNQNTTSSVTLNDTGILSEEEMQQRLAVFMEMQECTYPAALWQYDHALAGGISLFGDPLFQPNYFSSPADWEGIRAYGSEGKRTPLIWEYQIGFFWILAFDEEHTYFLGPYFTGHVSRHYLEQQIDRYEGLSLRVRHQLLQILTFIPIPPAEIIPVLALQLHRCIHQETINSSDVSYRYGSSGENEMQAAGSRTKLTKEALSVQEPYAYHSEHRGVRELELSLMEMVQEGNMQYKDKLVHGQLLSQGVRTHKIDPLRQLKDSAITTLALVSRAAMNGGLAPGVAYDLNDRYIDRIEECTSVSQTGELILQLMDDYVLRVHHIRVSEGVSREVLQVCDYIEAHLKEPLDAQTIAGRMGYTPYYLSRKFQKEMKQPLSSYVREHRLRAAATALRQTDLPISEIATEFCFASRSYFSTEFTRMFGCTPAAWRNRLV